MVDVLPLSHPLWKDFRDRLTKIGARPCNELSLNLDDVTAETKSFDVEDCSGFVYQVPNPIYSLL